MRLPMAGRSSSRDGAFELDGQVGDAAAGIELERGGDGGGRAGGDAAGAGAATVLLRRVRLQFERGDDLGEEEPVARAGG